MAWNIPKDYSERFLLCPTGDYEANIEGLFIKFKNNSEKFKRITFNIENYKEVKKMAKKNNPWIAHLQKVRKENKGKSVGEIAKIAKSTYVKKK